MKLVIAISGASGIVLAKRAIEALPPEIELYTILSDHARTVLQKEPLDRETILFEEEQIGAPVASGSFGTDAMLVLPCSMNTLAKIAVGIADTLTTRAAAVMIKERKKLILAPREMPLSAIALEHMLKLSRLGVDIAPPILGYYSAPQTLRQMEDFLIGKWFDLLGIDHTLYRRWEG